MAIAPIFKRQGWKRSDLLRQLVIYSITILIVMMSPAIDQSLVLGQLPSLTTPSNTQSPPVGVERRGTLESTWVYLDGKELFRIASPAVLNRSEPSEQIPVEIRAKQIEANLALVVASGGLSGEEVLDPKTLQVLIETVNEQPVLFVKDKNLAEAKVLLTVTDADAQYALVSKERLANKWKKILEQELRQALELRQPEALRQQISTVIKALVTTALLTLMLGIAWAFFGRRKQQLEQRQAAESALIHTQKLATLEPLDAESGLQFFQRLQYHFGLQERFQIVRFVRWLLFWAIAFVWMIGIAYSLNAFPQTRHFAQKIVIVPIVVLIAWFFMGLINQLSDFGIDRFIWRWEQEQLLTGVNLQRIATIANAFKGLKKVLIYTVGIFWVLQWLDVVPVSILALGALFALTVSFVAQSLLKDLVNGFLILLEDQFRIGDYIRVGDVSGKVENLNLRITQIRSDAGNLITLPNSLIAQVENMSRIWARADFRIEVAYHTNIDRALAVVRETVDQMAQEPEWQSTILDTHELFGVDQISHTGITIRIWIKTAPLKQWRVAQELRRRLKIAFDRHNIQIGIPVQVILENGFGKPSTIEDSRAID
jgi:moderate conductance mechanosensitive channel